MQSPNIRFPEGPILSSVADLDVPNLASEPILHVSTARVVLAEYALIQHDFPELSTPRLIEKDGALASLGGAELDAAVQALIDEWLLANAAYVSVPQAAQAIINTRICTDGAALGYRPPGYGRAVVVPAGGLDERWPSSMSGLLDLKGAGVRPGETPKRASAADGLEHLAIALYDYSIQRIVNAIFEREIPTMWTVPIYAVLDLGFDLLDGPLGTGAAGMHVRRAHRRVLNNEQLGPAYVRISLEVEQTLRKYGITAASRRARAEITEVDGQLRVRTFGRLKTHLSPEETGLCLQLLRGRSQVIVDRGEVQLARGATWPPASAQMYDFGTLRVERAFHYPLGHLSSISASLVVWPDGDKFVQPDPEQCLPFAVWNRPTLQMVYRDIVLRFRRGELSAADLRQGLEELLKPVLERVHRRRQDGPMLPPEAAQQAAEVTS